MTLTANSVLLQVLNKHNKDKDDKINKTELRNALNDVRLFQSRLWIPKDWVACMANKEWSPAYRKKWNKNYL